MEMRLYRSAQLLLLFVATAITSACNPSAYTRPAQDFLAATDTLEQIYFLEWDISGKATVELGDLEDQFAIWGAPAGVSAEQIERVAARMQQRRSEDIHGELRPLREQAFAALKGYADTLAALSSDAPTGEITGELRGLVDDMSGIVARAGELSADISRVRRFTGPLEQYVNILNELITLVSDIMREKAIVATIVKSNRPVNELLGILREEALFAERNADEKLGSSSAMLDRFINSDQFANASNLDKANIAARRAGLGVLREQMERVEIEETFTLALEAQGALLNKAVLDDPGEWSRKIAEFRNRVERSRIVIETIRADM